MWARRSIIGAKTPFVTLASKDIGGPEKAIYQPGARLAKVSYWVSGSRPRTPRLSLWRAGDVFMSGVQFPHSLWAKSVFTIVVALKPLQTPCRAIISLCAGLQDRHGQVPATSMK